MSTTINAGVTATISLSAEQIIIGRGPGSAVITSTQASFTQPLTAGDEWRIGPFDQARTVGITAGTAAITYDVSTFVDPARSVVVGDDGQARDSKNGAPVSGASVPFSSLAGIAAAVGTVLNVSGVGPSPVPFEKTGFGWRPAQAFGLQPLRGDYTHTDAYADTGIAWHTTLPAGLLAWGFIVIEPLVTFPSSASTKNIALKVNGTSFWSKSRTTSTHEAPLIVVQARDTGVVNNPYVTNSVHISGGTGFVAANQSLNTLTDPVELSLQVSFGAAAAGSESIVVRSVRARFHPF